MDTSGAHAIDTLDDLRRHLQWAIELEHCTLPPYLCALYSIKDETNRWNISLASLVREVASNRLTQESRNQRKTG